MAHLDILIFALIAVVVFARLWVVFGRRNEEDRQQPNPFATPAPPTAGPPDKLAEKLQDSGKEASKTDGIIAARKLPDTAVPPRALLPMGSAPASLAGGLERVKAADPSFDERAFLRTCRTNFTAIVSAFAKGDLSDVKKYLAPSIEAHFQKAIDARRAANETLESHIEVIRDCETTAAKVEDGRTIVTVRFVSDQENILKDSAGKILSGEAGTVEEITDLWTLSHELRSSSPDWLLIETK
jgi:predicted lipid-binding transport protein (Tim44 family)